MWAVLAVIVFLAGQAYLFHSLGKVDGFLAQQEEVPELIYRGISFLGYDLEWEAYERLTAELKNGK